MTTMKGAKKNRNYSILFMRDDSNVSRFRLSAFGLKFLIYFFIFLFLAAAAGSYGTWYYNKRYRIAVSERDTLNFLISDYKEQAERLVRLEELLRRSDSSELRALNTLVRPQPGMVGSNTRPAGSSGNGNGPVTGAENATASQSSGTTTTASVAPTDSDTTVTNPADATITGTQTTPQESGPSTTPILEKKPIEIINAKVSMGQGNTVNINFELTNNDQGTFQSGQINLYVVTPSGVVPVLGTPQENLKFQINYRKKVRASFAMPKDIDLSSVSQVRLEIESKNYAPYTEDIEFSK